MATALAATEAARDQQAALAAAADERGHRRLSRHHTAELLTAEAQATARTLREILDTVNKSTKTARPVLAPRPSRGTGTPSGPTDPPGSAGCVLAPRLTIARSLNRSSTLGVSGPASGRRRHLLRSIDPRSRTLLSGLDYTAGYQQVPARTDGEPDPQTVQPCRS